MHLIYPYYVYYIRISSTDSFNGSSLGSSVNQNASCVSDLEDHEQYIRRHRDRFLSLDYGWGC